jgi:hypothetical protein
VLVEHVLDFGRIDIFPTGNVYVLPAIHDVVVAFLIDPRRVPGISLTFTGGVLTAFKIWPPDTL